MLVVSKPPSLWYFCYRNPDRDRVDRGGLQQSAHPNVELQQKELLCPRKKYSHVVTSKGTKHWTGEGRKKKKKYCDTWFKLGHSVAQAIKQ